MAARRFHGEAGDTLVELLMAIAIGGIAVTGLLAGLGTAINLSATHRGQANADTVLVSAADSVKSQTYVPCPSVSNSSYNPTSGVLMPSGWSPSNVTITQVGKWNGSSFQTSCPSTDRKLQLITITVTTPDGKSSETIDVVKRNSS